MAKVTNKQIVNALIKAKTQLSNGSTAFSDRYLSRYICFALDQAVDNQYVVDQVQDIIQDRLYPRCSVYGYLHYTLKIKSKLLTEKNVQTFRHDWLDSLIKEFSK